VAKLAAVSSAWTRLLRTQGDIFCCCGRWNEEMMFQLKQFVCECWSLHQPSFCPPKKQTNTHYSQPPFLMQKGFSSSPKRVKK
jgi:hypothetical protein